MPTIPSTEHDRYKRLLTSMREDRQPWREHWRLIADYVMPRRYNWLQSQRESRIGAQLANPLILDGAATLAARTLAAGMMNGITSPARPWFRLSAPQFRNNARVRKWLDQAQSDMLFAMAESNFYNALAVQYLDLSIFQTSAMFIYEDDVDVFRCYNYALGEYFFSQNNRHVVDRFGREFSWRVEQVVAEFGLENCSEYVQERFKRGGEGYNQTIDLVHMIEPNGPPYREIGVPQSMPFRELYWEAKGRESGKLLRVRGFNEWPGSCPRWEIIGNDAYGAGPSSDAMGDIRQLQHMTKRKLEAMDYMVSPPVVADIQLQHRATALLPRGITYVAGANNIGVKPIYTINPPIGEIDRMIEQLRGRIQEYYHNDLFRMISSLETVRSATEIDARREEKLVLLGPVLDRFQSEALDASVRRIFGIMYRNGLFPPVPPELEDAEAMIDYTSVLSDAQRAVGAAPLERGVAFVGNIAAAVPEALAVVDWEETIRDYWGNVGISEKNLRTREAVAEDRAQQQQQKAVAGAAEVGPPLAQSAKLLSETPVGGASDALSMILGNQ